MNEEDNRPVPLYDTIMTRISALEGSLKAIDTDLKTLDMYFDMHTTSEKAFNQWVNERIGTNPTIRINNLKDRMDKIEDELLLLRGHMDEDHAELTKKLDTLAKDSAVKHKYKCLKCSHIFGSTKGKPRCTVKGCGSTRTIRL